MIVSFIYTMAESKASACGDEVKERYDRKDTNNRGFRADWTVKCNNENVHSNESVD